MANPASTAAMTRTVRLSDPATGVPAVIISPAIDSDLS